MAFSAFMIFYVFFFPMVFMGLVDLRLSEKRNNQIIEITEII